CSNYLASVLPGSRPDIHDVICSKHGIFIVLYHNQRISKITKMFERTEQLVIISLMESDTWLIQNVGDSDKSGSNLCCKPDSLCLSSGQRSGCSGKRQIIQSYIHQKSCSGLDLF